MKSRFLIISLFVLLSIVSWYFLDGAILRNYIALIPLLFSLQILLNDFIESYLFINLNTFWFKLLIFPGTVLHELSHFLAAELSGCNVISFSLFRFDSHAQNLGSVEYEQPIDRFSVIRSFIVGFAPFFGCGMVLIALLNLVHVYYSGTYSGMAFSHRVMEADTLESILDSVYLIVTAFYQQFYIFTLKPALFLILYLQVCVGLGAAPSSVDFKGSFSSLVKHPLGTLVLLLFFASVFFISEYPPLSKYVVFVFKWILLILLASISLLIASIPVIYVGTNFIGFSFMKKIIIVTLSGVTYLVTSNQILAFIAFIVPVLVFRHSWIFLKETRKH